MKNEIYIYLKNSQLPVKRSILLDHLIKKGYDVTDRKLRSTVEEMITDEDSIYCIESSEKGYSIIQTDEEEERAYQYMTSKIEALCVRRNCNRRNYLKAKEAKNEPILKDNQFIMFP